MLQGNGQWMFLILGVPVYARNLPFGNMTVFHPYNESVRRMVEPICRGKGHWRAEYKNWLIFDQFRDAVLEELARLERQ